MQPRGLLGSLTHPLKAPCTAVNRRPPPILLLAMASGMSPFGMTIILPALPEITRSFNATYADVQWLVSAYLLGIAAAQPLVGFLCDRVGRRPVFLGGFSLFVITSVLLSFAETLPQLIGLRVLQAVGGSTGTVVSRAVIRDLYTATNASQAISVIAMGMGVAPIIAPLAGGWTLAVADYPAIFLLTAACGGVVLMSLAAWLVETMRRTPKEPAMGWLQRYSLLFTSRAFMGFTLIMGFVQGSFFAFLAVGADVFQTHFGIGPAGFGTLWGGMSSAYVLGAMVGGKQRDVGAQRFALAASVTLSLLFGCLLYALTVAWGTKLVICVPLLAALMITSGIISPLVMAGAVNYHQEIAGTSAGLSSALGLVIGSSFTILAGFAYRGEFEPIAGLVGIAAALTFASWLIVRRLNIAPTSPG